MAQAKQNEQESVWHDPARKYHEAHEEITRRKNENKQVEDALFQVVQVKPTHKQFSPNQQAARKQSMNKLLGLFSSRKNKN